MLKKLILSLALGSSAIASAAPCNEAPVSSAPVSAPVASASVYSAGVVAAVHVPVDQPRWRSMTLASETTFERNGQRTIFVGAKDGKFRDLAITSDYGDPLIQTVIVKLANGREMVKNLDQRVGNGQSLRIALDRDGDGDEARTIQSITVIGGSHFQNGRLRTQGRFNVVGIR